MYYLKLIAIIAVIIGCLYFCYWMICEGGNVRDDYERNGIIEDDFV
jgi:hypothetical protein